MLEAETKRPTIETTSQFDVLLKGGRVVDPANGIDSVMDVAIKDGKIVAVAEGLPVYAAKTLRDVTGLAVLPGLIDTHTHIFEFVSGDFGLNPDEVGVRSGVTTVCDQGGTSALTINGFRKFIAEAAETDVKCFISAYLAGGLHGHRHVGLYGPSGVNVDAIVMEAKRNRDMVRGIKVHVEVGGYSRWGVDVLKLAKEAGRKLGLPTYIHLGRMWPNAENVEVDPKQVIEDMVPLLDPGDIIAHPYTHRPAGFVSPEGEVHPLIFKALEHGVRLDVGHGSHFSFEAAKAVMAAGIVPYTLGSDLHGSNTGKTRRSEDPALNGEDSPFDYDPSFSLYTAMSEMLAIGIPEAHVFKMVTTHAADMLQMTDTIGTLGVGRRADVTVLNLAKGDFTLADKSGASMPADTLFMPVCAFRAGSLHEVDSPLLPERERRLAA